MVVPVPRPTPASPCFLGADVSKDWVDLADTAGRLVHADNTREALCAVLSDPCWHDRCANLVCEATGGYERPLIEAATTLGLPIRRIHPSRARAFARAKAGWPRPTGSTLPSWRHWPPSRRTRSLRRCPPRPSAP